MKDIFWIKTKTLKSSHFNLMPILWDPVGALGRRMVVGLIECDQ